jgi:hypothetical protein
MKRYFTFLGVGSFFATVEEFLTVVVLRNDVASYVFTLLVLFPVFLTFVWLSSRFIDKRIERPAVQAIVHFFVYGGVGLAIEWFLIGLSPWSNPNANPVLMLIFQLGMFSFWATVAFAPRLFLDPHDRARSVRRAILRFYIPYFAAVYVIGLSAPAEWKFGTIIPLVLLGYLFLNVFYVRYFLQLFRGGERVMRSTAPESQAIMRADKIDPQGA